MTGRLTCCLFCDQKCNINWGLQQLREVWTKNLKPSESGWRRWRWNLWQGRGKAQGIHVVWMRIRLRNRWSLPMTRETQTRASPSKSYVKPQVDQQEEWVQGKPNNDNFGRKTSFTVVMDNCKDTIMWTELTLILMLLGCTDSFMVPLHLKAG